MSFCKGTKTWDLVSLVNHKEFSVAETKGLGGRLGLEGKPREEP